MKKILKELLIIILAVTLFIPVLAICLPSSYFYVISMDKYSSWPLQLIFSLQYINTILIVIFGFLIYKKQK